MTLYGVEGSSTVGEVRGQAANLLREVERKVERKVAGPLERILSERNIDASVVRVAVDDVDIMGDIDGFYLEVDLLVSVSPRPAARESNKDLLERILREDLKLYIKTYG